MKAPQIPKTLVKLGRAVEIDGDQWVWTWTKKDDFCVACNVSGRCLYIFPLGRSSARANPKKGGLIVQSVLFDSGQWTKKAAVDWLKKNGFAGLICDETRDHFRYRQVDPIHFKRRSFRTKDLDSKRGIKAIMAIPSSKHNPSGGELAQAKKLFKRFNHYDATKELIVSVAEKGSEVGSCNHIIYESDKFGKKEHFIHKFEDRPIIFVDNPQKPRVLVLYGKHTKVTFKGIEG